MTDMSWERKPTKNTPPPRYAHASVYTSGQLFVYGGASTSKDSSPRDSGTTTKGGSTSTSVILNDLYVLNTRDWTWKQIIINDSFPLYPLLAPTSSVNANII